MLNNTDIKIPEELECVWTGKNKTTLPIYTPVAEKTKGAFVGSIYEKSSTTSIKIGKKNSRWLGKLGMANPNLYSKNTLSISKMHRGANRDAVKEKIASDFYYLLACASDLAFDVPKARLAELPVINPYTEKNELAKFIVDEINRNSSSEKDVIKAIHIMSKWVNGYQDLAEANVCNDNGMIVPYLTHLKETGCLSDTIFVKGKNIPLVGLVELLAAARLLGDVDVLGNGGSNTGFIVQEDLRGMPISAKIVKIDPGFVFTVNEQESLLFATLYPSNNPITRKQQRTLKDIKDIQIGTSTDILVYWSSLTKNQKSRFLKTLQEGMKLLSQRNIVTYLFSRNEKFNAYGTHALMTEEIIENYALSLENLLDAQQKAYGDLFNEIIVDDKQKIQEITEELRTEKEASKNKDLIITSKDQIILTNDQQLQIKETEIQRQQQMVSAKDQQLQIKETEIQRQQQVILTKENDLKTKISNITALESENRELKKSMQGLKDSELSLKMQIAEYQKQQPFFAQNYYTKQSPIYNNANNNSLKTTSELGIINDKPKPLQMPTDEPTKKDLAALLTWVTEGQLIEVEKLLQKNSELTLMTGTVTDLSDRTFNNITVFQYSVWALDIEMCEVILKYLDNRSALTQLQSLEAAPERYSRYGAHYDITPLVTKTREYLDNYSKWDYKKCEQHWQKEVGGAQRQCPAWLIYAWCEKGAEVAWVKKDLASIQFTRQYDQDLLKWWFTGVYNEGKGVGSTWAVDRGAGKGPLEVHSWGMTSYERGWAIKIHSRTTHHDLEVSLSIGRESQEAVKSLKTDLENSLIHNDSSVGMKSQSEIQSQKIEIKQPEKININTQKSHIEQHTIFNNNQPSKPKSDINNLEDKQTKKDLTALLKWVIEGHLFEVEKLLKKNPKLTLMTGTVTDLSDRTFNNITVFQYAAWALDIGMWNLILKYLDNASALTQLQSLEATPEKYSRYGAHYDIMPLVTKTREYLDNYSKWDYKKCEQHWQKEVGGAQRQCPAWLIYAWCEKGAGVAWVKKDLASIQFTRQYDQDLLKWWFTKEYYAGSGVGTSWAVARGDANRLSQIIHRDMHPVTFSLVHHDLEVSLSVGRQSHEAVKSLKTRLENSIINNNNSMDFKYG